MVASLGLVESYIRALTVTCLEPLMAPYHQHLSIVVDALGDLDLHPVYPSLSIPPSSPIPTLPLLMPSTLCGVPLFPFLHLENSYSAFKNSSGLLAGVRRHTFSCL